MLEDKIVNFLGVILILMGTGFFLWIWMYNWFKKKGRLAEFLHQEGFPLISYKIGKEFFDEHPSAIIYATLVLGLLSIIVSIIL